jgi:Mce-associated membrane protein
MVTPRERSRPTRRRIAGERSRLATGAPDSPQGPESPQTSPEGPQTPGSPVTRAGRDRPSGRGAAAPAEEQARPTPTARTVKTAEKPVEPAQGDEPATQKQVNERKAKERKAKERKAKPPWPGKPEKPATAVAAARAGGAPPNWVLAVLAGLLVAALALDGFVTWREVSQRNAEEASARALHSALIQSPSVAEQAAVPLLSYRYDTIDKDLAEAQRYLTDEFRPGYTASIDKLVRQEARRARATVKAEVLNSGIVEAGGHRAEVLLFVNQTTSSPTRSEPTTALNRVVFSMVRRDGTWKVADIRAF